MATAHRPSLFQEQGVALTREQQFGALLAFR